MHFVLFFSNVIYIYIYIYIYINNIYIYLILYIYIYKFEKMGPLDDPMADDFFIPNPPLDTIYCHTKSKRKQNKQKKNALIS